MRILLPNLSQLSAHPSNLVQSSRTSRTSSGAKGVTRSLSARSQYALQYHQQMDRNPTPGETGVAKAQGSGSRSAKMLQRTFNRPTTTHGDQL